MVQNNKKIFLTFHSTNNNQINQTTVTPQLYHDNVNYFGRDDEATLQTPANGTFEDEKR